MNLFCTADEVGIETGGGKVTARELEAFLTFGPCSVLGRKELAEAKGEDPWHWDQLAVQIVGEQYAAGVHFELAHFYSGTFSQTVKLLQSKGCKVSYTCAAHDVAESKKEHELNGILFPYAHLVIPELWARYVQGYLDADVMIVPSMHSQDVVQAQGRTRKIELIPHGVEVPESVAPMPARFVCGYLGSYGFDKGVRYLLEAWKKLNYSDAVLMLGGKSSTHPYVSNLIAKFGGGSIIQRGWVKQLPDFYNRCSVYVQPSVSEGFGIEVIEAMAYGRPVICSEGAGACYLLDGDPNQPDAHRKGQIFDRRDVNELAHCIDWCKQQNIGSLTQQGSYAREQIKSYATTDIVKQQYIATWRNLLGA